MKRVTVGIRILALLIIAISLTHATKAFQNVPGLIVEEVPDNSPAAKAGLKTGDRLMAYDDRWLSSPAALSAGQQNTFGKKEVVIRVKRGENLLMLKVPLGDLGLEVRPNFSPTVLKLYEEGMKVLRDQDGDQAINKWVKAARVAQEEGDDAAAACLYGWVGGIYEIDRQWNEARAAHMAAWELLKNHSDAAAKSLTLSALGTCSQNLNDFTAAKRWYESAQQVEEVAGYEMWLASDLNNLGILAHERYELAAAQEHYKRALTIYERLAPISLTQAAILNNLGLIASDRNDYDAAQKYLEGALDIKERLVPNSLAVASTLNNLGKVAGKRGDFDAAKKYFERTVTIYERLEPNSLGAASSFNNLGKIALGRDDLEAAQKYFMRALKIREHLAPNSLDFASSLNSMGDLLRSRGDLREAQEYYTRALAIYEQFNPNSMEVASTLNSLGLVTLNRGNLQPAQEYYTRSLAISERIAPNAREVAANVGQLGHVASERGDLQLAKECYTRALEIFERLDPNSLEIAAALNNLGNIASRSGDLKTSQNYYKRALVMSERLKLDSLITAANVGNLGNVAYEGGDLNAAQKYYTRALESYERLEPNSLHVAASLNNLGRVARDRGDLDAARKYFNRSLAICERLSPDSLPVAVTLDSLGGLALRERRFTDAASLFTRAVSIIEAQRQQILSSEARALFVDKYSQSYTGLLKTYLMTDDFPAAFATLERARARSLTELLAEQRVNSRTGVPIELITRQDELDEKRSFAYNKLISLDPNKEDRRITELQNDLIRYGIRQRELDAQIRSASPKFATLQYPQPLNLNGAQAVLDPGTLLLAYYVDEEQTYLFAVTRNSLKLLTLKVSKKALDEEVRVFQEQVAKKRLGDPRERGKKLYDTLIGPAQELVTQAKRILICPDGSLHTLPFAALVRQIKPDLRYFVEDKPLHTIVSITVYAETRKAAVGKEQREKTLLAVGAPVYAKQQTESAKRSEPIRIARGHEREKKEETERDAEMAYARRRGLKLEPLPWAREEVEQIGKLFGKQATIKLDQEATETIVKQESKNYSMLHFAVHGWLDEQIGLNSGLALSQPEVMGKEKTKDDNGLLQAWEIFEQMRLNADLVVLSACETGLGQNIRGEGLIGLTRAFQYAGTKSIVVSLWGVNDASTSALMTRFYQELGKGMSKDIALQRAMETVRNNPKWRHPFYWSSFILVGDWQ